MNFLTVDLAMAAVEEPSAKRQKIEEKPEDSAEDVSNGKEEEVEKKKPSGIPLICGSMNWDLMGREKSRVNTKPRKVEPAWTPQIISALSEVRVTDIIAGPCAAHSFFITDKGKLFGLGRNESGQLGLGNTIRQDGAIEIPFFVDKKVIGAAVGRGHSIVLTEDGAYGMGENDMGQLGIGTNVGKGATVTTPKPVQLQQKVKNAACGFDFTLFVTSKGFLYSAGSSESGQLGINDNGEYIEGRKLFYTAHAVPTRVHSFFTKDPRTKEVTRVPNVLIRYVSAGQHHCLAISENDELYTWGFNGHGRLGHRTTENELIPMRVLHFRPGDKNSSVKIAKCSYGGCFAVNNLGNLYCWGQNQINRLECPYPIPVEDLYGWNVNDIGPGKNHHVVAADFSSIAFGKATTGELGMGHTVKSSSRPDKMHGVDGLKMIQCGAGAAHTLLLAADDDDESKEILKKLDVNDD
ncbi:hypothetical protein ACHWQZ_G011354 [Mnemiopsis leidyi]